MTGLRDIELFSSDQPEGTQVGWWSLSGQNERGYRRAVVVAGRIGNTGVRLVQTELTKGDGTVEQYTPHADGLTLVTVSSALGIRPETRLEPSGSNMRGLINPTPRINDSKNPDSLFANGDINPDVADRIFCEDIAELWPGIRKALDDTDNSHALAPLYFNFNAAPFQIGKTTYSTGIFDPKLYQVADPAMAPMTFKALEMIKKQQAATAAVIDKIARQREELVFGEGANEQGEDIEPDGAHYADRIARENLHEIPSAHLFYDGPLNDFSPMKSLGRRAEYLSRSLAALTALHEAENTR